MKDEFQAQVRNPDQQLYKYVTEKYEADGVLDAIDAEADLHPTVVKDWAKGGRVIPAGWVVKIRGVLQNISRNPDSYPALVLKTVRSIKSPSGENGGSPDLQGSQPVKRERSARVQSSIRPTNEQQKVLEDRIRSRNRKV
jgi:hypothetical protein